MKTRQKASRNQIFCLPGTSAGSNGRRPLEYLIVEREVAQRSWVSETAVEDVQVVSAAPGSESTRMRHANAVSASLVESSAPHAMPEPSLLGRAVQIR